MVTVKFHMRIKPEHNPPVFDEKLGKGVIATVEVEYPGVSLEDFKNSVPHQKEVYDQAEKLLKNYFEVIKEVVI